MHKTVLFYSKSHPTPNKHLYFLAKHDCASARCLALRTTNGGFKNSFIPRELSPTHLVAPQEVEMWHDGFPTIHFRLPDLTVDFVLPRTPFLTSRLEHIARLEAQYKYVLSVVNLPPMD